MSEPSPHPEHRTMKFTDARAQLSSLVNEVHAGGSRVVIEKNGIPAAVLVSPADLEWLERSEAARAADLAVIAEIAAAFADEPLDEIERQTARAIARARADRAARLAS